MSTSEPDVALLRRQLLPGHQQLLSCASQVPLPASPERSRRPLPSDIVHALLDVQSVDDVLPALEAIATTGQPQILRTLYMVASKIQEGIRQVKGQLVLQLTISHWNKARVHLNVHL